MADTVQQVLVMSTYGDSLRSEALGWTAADPRNVGPRRIGMSRSWGCPRLIAALARALREVPHA